MTVPELPTSTLTVEPGAGAPGVTRSSVPWESMVQPRARSAPMARDESRACRTPCSTDGESLSAARMRARLVIDFEPGSRSVARTGPSRRWGAPASGVHTLEGIGWHGLASRLPTGLPVAFCG